MHRKKWLAGWVGTYLVALAIITTTVVPATAWELFDSKEKDVQQKVVIALNAATPEELATLFGLDAGQAQAIIKARPLKTAKDLTNSAGRLPQPGSNNSTRIPTRPSSPCWTRSPSGASPDRHQADQPQESRPCKGPGFLDTGGLQPEL